MKDYRSETGPSPELRAIEERHATEQKHTPEPQFSIEWDGKFTVSYAVNAETSSFRVLPEFARRIVACLKVCTNVTNGGIEQLQNAGGLAKTLDVLTKVRDQRDSLAATLQAILMHDKASGYSDAHIPFDVIEDAAAILQKIKV